MSKGSMFRQGWTVRGVMLCHADCGSPRNFRGRDSRGKHDPQAQAKSVTHVLTYSSHSQSSRQRTENTSGSLRDVEPIHAHDTIQRSHAPFAVSYSVKYVVPAQLLLPPLMFDMRP